MSGFRVHVDAFLSALFRLLGGGLVLLCAFLVPVAQGESHVQDDLHLWSPIILEVKPAERWRVGFEAQPRLTQNLSELGILQLRPSVAYDRSPRWSFSGGVLYQPPINESFEEHRIWQQVLHTQQLKSSKINYQFRLEERFIDAPSEMSLRGRYLMRYIKPLGKTPWFWVTSNEIHMNFNHTSSIPLGFNQNRTFVGLRRKLGDRTMVEGGYMAVFVNNYGDKADNLNHVILLRLVHTLADWTKGQHPVDILDNPLVIE